MTAVTTGGDGQQQLEAEAENEQKVVLRKAVSDVSQEMEKYLIVKSELETIIEEVEQAECECCGLKEECTRVYKRQVQERYCGKWVCGLCAEAVKERVVVLAMEDALNQHKDFCNHYNATTRINPKLSLTLSMRQIAKRSLEKRKSMSKLGRSSSYP
ncbi:uncharacterized protein LOC107470693 [Arachis duranensis]|uniref:Uncharacterized protein LOC107470693 n=1 Tax=Arachis duranensis TaxID=130453 RepID=A0A9C6TCH6_ARADU|nr:uncharacterized protein LOC107470693 [Arachis duranensis]